MTLSKLEFTATSVQNKTHGQLKTKNGCGFTFEQQKYRSHAVAERKRDQSLQWKQRNMYSE